MARKFSEATATDLETIASMTTAVSVDATAAPIFGNAALAAQEEVAELEATQGFWLYNPFVFSPIVTYVEPTQEDLIAADGDHFITTKTIGDAADFVVLTPSGGTATYDVEAGFNQEITSDVSLNLALATVAAADRVYTGIIRFVNTHATNDVVLTVTGANLALNQGTDDLTVDALTTGDFFILITKTDAVIWQINGRPAA